VDRFEQISSECARRAWALAYSLTRNAADADDVVQKACLVAWQRRDVIPSDPWPWFAVVTTNCARNLRRGSARRRAREENLRYMPPDSNVDPRSEAEQAELRNLLLGALAELPAEEREAVALCHIAGLTQTQASEATGTNLNTLKSRVKRGLDRMRGRLQPKEAALEAYLSAMVIPIPTGGWDATIARWESSAKVGATESGLTFGFVLKLAGALVVPSAAAFAAWLLLDLGAEPTRPAPGIVAFTAEPRLVSDANDGGRASESADDVKRRAGRVKLPIAVPEQSVPLEPSAHAAIPPGDEPSGKQVLSPLPGAETASLRVRSSFYDSGPLYMQWIEEVTAGGAILQGSHIRLHLNGSVWEEGQYLNNKREGLWITRHEDGARASQGSYHQGLSEGVWTWWYADGQERARGEFRRDLREGPWQYWHANGQPKTEMHFKSGVADGLSTHFDEQGRKVRTTTWREGKKHGPEVEFDQYGNALPTKHYVEGAPQ